MGRSDPLGDHVMCLLAGLHDGQKHEDLIKTYNFALEQKNDLQSRGFSS